MTFLVNLIKRGIKRFLTIQVMVFSTIFGVFFVFLFIGVFALAVTDASDSAPKTEDGYLTVSGEEDADITLLSIPIHGVIMGESEDLGGFFESFTEGIVYGYDIKDELIAVAEKDDIDGVILEVDSPGGTIFGSVAISEGVKAYKEKSKKPIYVYVSGMAASGGYWASANADKIIADYGTAIGSIGVISGPFKYYDTVKTEGGGIFAPTIETENGIQTEYITAGTYKDLGNPYRPMSDEERLVLQTGADNAYNAFVNYISDSRKIEQDQIRNQIKALIYDETQALSYKLIDAVGGRDNAYQQLAEAAGNQQNFRVVREDDQGDILKAVFGVSQNFIKSEPRKISICDKVNVMAFHGDWQKVCTF